MSTPKHPVLDRSERLRATINRQQLDCLDSTWQGWEEPHRFRCAKGHVFSQTPRRLTRRQESCRQCIQDRHTDQIRTIAQEAGVIWLDEQWLGWDALYSFRCTEGHTWQRKPSTLSSHPGCNACKQDRAAHLKVLSDGLARLQQIAAQHGGQCLTQAYTGTRERYGFRCAKGHVWEALGVNIMGGSWCSQCSVRPRPRGDRSAAGLARLREMAERNGGVCLDQAYQGVTHYYQFRCRAGHQWTMVGRSALHGTWCVKCHLKARAPTLDEAHEIARAKGGVCLSSECLSAHSRLQWQCQWGHGWYATMGSVKKGSWCKRCPPGKLSLDDAHRAARARGGECLSTEYVRSSSKMHWRCARGHEWHGQLTNVRRGHWCRQCAFMEMVTKASTMERYLPAR